MTRRSFASTSAAAWLTAAAPPPIRILDTHIHLFDPTRPQGVPWPPKDNPVLYKPATVARYRSIAAPLGVVGAIKVEASPWVEDNQWVLDIAAKEKLIVGVIGNLEPGKPEFAKNFDRFHKNPLFLGIRYGNLWDRDLAKGVSNPAVSSDLRLLADADLTLDTANPNRSLLQGVLRLNDLLPGLRIVIDHLPQMQPTEADLKEFASRQTIFVKISEVFRKVNGQVPRDLSLYKGTIDTIFSIFGENRVLFGSDWPNSDSWRPYSDGLSLVQEYFGTKPRIVAEKYFAKNSTRAYRWIKRDPSQTV